MHPGETSTSILGIRMPRSSAKVADTTTMEGNRVQKSKHANLLIQSCNHVNVTVSTMYVQLLPVVNNKMDAFVRAL